MHRPRNLFIRPRIVLKERNLNINGVQMVGRYNNTSAQDSLPVHAHRDAMEICFLVKGRQTYHAGGRDHVLCGGDVFITFPNELHSTGDTPQEKGVLYWVILQFPRKKQSPFLGLPEHDAASLIRELLRIKSRHFRGSWDMKELLDGIIVACHQSASPLRKTIIANRLVAFLLRVIECSYDQSMGPSGERFREVLRTIKEDLGGQITITSLAAKTGLSVSRFKARFKEETGMPPGEYILRMKIDEAKRQLAAGGGTVTDTAFALGFPTSQYFATVFKRFTGKRPSEFQKAVRDGA